MDINNIILFLVLIFFSLFFYKYFLILSKKYNINFLVDDEFKKPQAFHESPIPTAGGVCLFLSFLILSLYLFLSQEIVYYDYLLFCLFFFILGLSDDLRFNLRPKFRLLSMVAILILLVINVHI